MLLLNTRSLWNAERRDKLVNAVTLSQYNVICLCETWLTNDVEDSELQLNQYDIYRADRPSSKEEYSAHGGSLIAVKKTLSSKQLHIDLPECCVACSITINKVDIVLCTLYNPPSDSEYRYKIADFEKIFNSLPKSKPLIICGDMNMPKIDWNTLCSSDDYEQTVLDLFGHHLLQQVVDFPTCSNSLDDLVFHRKCTVLTEKDEDFTKVYNITDHQAVKMRLECPHNQPKPIYESYRSYGSADFCKMNDIMSRHPFTPVCHTNIDNMYFEFCQYNQSMIEECVPLRTKHRQEMPPWITPSTSNLINKLKTQRKLLVDRPTTYRRNHVANLENVVAENCEIDRLNYQEELFSTRNTEKIFKHLKYLNKKNCIPKVVYREGEASCSEHERARFFNEFFHSVYSPKKNYSLKDIRNENPVLTNFDVSKAKVRSILANLDITKSRGPNKLPPVLFRETALEISTALNKIFRNVKRLRKLPKAWKDATIVPVYKSGDKQLTKNYRPVSLLDVDSKAFEKCMYDPLYAYFSIYLSKHQHGFVRGRSVQTNMLKFLKDIHEALDKNSSDQWLLFMQTLQMH